MPWVVTISIDYSKALFYYSKALFYYSLLRRANWCAAPEPLANAKGRSVLCEAQGAERLPFGQGIFIFEFAPTVQAC